MSKNLISCAGFFGLTALILDAVGAHILPNILLLAQDEKLMALQSWKTATQYQLVHALLLMGLFFLFQKQPHWTLKLSSFLTVLGVILFCGAIYIKILICKTCFGQLAPFGGVSLMCAWFFLGLSSFFKQPHL